MQHLFEEPLLAAEYAPGAFAPDVAEVLATGTVWVMDERLVTAQLKLASPPFSKRRVYRASPRFRMDGRQRRVPLDELADPAAGRWLPPGEEVSQGYVKLGEALVGPEVVFLAPAQGDELPQDLRISYPVRADELLAEILSTPGEAGQPPSPSELTLRDETRRSVLWPVGSRLTWSLAVPEGGSLRAGFGARRLVLDRRGKGVHVTERTASTVRFAIEVHEGGQPSEVVWESSGFKLERFNELEVDLSRFGGRTVELSLVTEHGQQVAQVHPFWAEPIVRAGERSGVSAEPTNVIVILLDTLRADRLGCYGWERAQTPNIDALAERGVRYESAWSAAPWTIPSHASLFTSTHVSEHGIWNRWQRLPESALTVAEVARAAGYGTAAFTGGGFVRAQYGFAQGHDIFVTTPSDEASTGFDRAWEWMQEVGPPFYAFVHTYQVHSPYDPPAPYREQLVRAYDGDLPGSVQPAQTRGAGTRTTTSRSRTSAICKTSTTRRLRPRMRSSEPSSSASRARAGWTAR